MIKKIKKNKGFVLLFAVTLAAIFLSIALGIASVSLKEVNFSTSVKNSNDAFYSADTGIECALYYDKTGVFIDPSTPTINCNGVNINVSEPSSSIWNFIVPNLDSTSQGCAIVQVDKSSDVTSPATTSITAYGYNIGGSSCNKPSNVVERVLQTNY